ncbi:MAG: T9SS C-terminal target domain-containing protein [Cryomorphaceae bacterium]|nr:MAG: T9SS C-terminal target domain-containing protein [Cryomorphaceae bacterium]
MKKLLYITLVAMLTAFSQKGRAQSECNIPTAFAQLDINNVRANYYNNGFQWNTRQIGRPGYEVPKGDNTHSIFSGRIVLGGFNQWGELRVTASIFHLTLNEESFRAGPMNNTSPGNFVTADCDAYDHIYKVNRSEVELHRLYFSMLAENNGIPPTTPPFTNGYEIPDDILNWPAVAEVIPGQPQALAPFFDNDCCGGTPGVYEPELGDYPAFRFPDNEDEFDCEVHLLGDQVLWWVNSNSEDGAIGNQEFDMLATGVEVHNMAYAFITNDHINNTTFLRQTLINRSGWQYSDMYFGKHIRSHLGSPSNDYVQKHVERGMSYYCNGHLVDEDNLGAVGYGFAPPAIGFTWVGGPLADENDGIDNNFNGIVDEPGERLRMYHSIYHNSNTGPIGTRPPQTAEQYYNYLTGHWRDGTPLTYGGTGYNPNDPDAVPCLIHFPGDSDPLLINTNGVQVEPWTELTELYAPGTRRHIMSSGPFSMAPDEAKVFTMAIPWARDLQCEEVPCSIELLYEANDLAQELHDNCYDFPCAVIDAAFEISIESGSAFFSSPITSGVSYTWTFGDGESFTSDHPFASHQYEQPGDIEVCLEIDFGCGTSSTCQSIGSMMCDMMTGPELTQIEGTGNTQHFFELTDETIDQILANDSNMVIHPTYKKGKGPVKVLVYNFEALVEGEYTLMFDGTEPHSNWKMFINGGLDTVHSEVPIAITNSQFIEEWGLMVSVDAHTDNESSAPIGAQLLFEDSNNPWLGHVEDTDDFTYQNWIREGTISFSCSGLSSSPCFYMDSLQTIIEPCVFNSMQPNTLGDVPFKSLVNGGWGPSHYVRKFSVCHPFFNAGVQLSVPHTLPGNVRNVDVVLTPDKSKWSRCVVLDLRYGSDVGSLPIFRSALSVDKNGRNQSHPECNVEEATYFGQQTDASGMSYGMGWFPGYAIDVNTGKRLNIIFGENPDLTDDNGNDMIWNPTSTMWNSDGSPSFGGAHAITVLSAHFMGQGNETHSMAEYDGCQQIHNAGSQSPSLISALQRRQQWTGLPLLNEGFELLPIEEGLIPAKTTIQLRLRHRYQNQLPGPVNINNGNPLYNFSINIDDLTSDVSEMQPRPEMLLYPNPSRGRLHVQFSNFARPSGELMVFSVSGKLVKRVRSDFIGEQILDMGDLPSGMYILRAGSQDGGEALYKRFVVVN